jgi:AcrR family transcriptional regulator
MIPLERPLRADAERNRSRLLDAAAAAFAAHGLDAPVTEIAQRAGVGQGTVFRHFASKEALVVAVVVERMRELTGRADAATELAAFMADFIAFYLRDHRLFEALEGPALATDEVLAEQGRLLPAIERLLVRSRAAGEVREDLEAVDVAFLASGVGHAAVPLHDAAPDLWRRYFGIVLDGLRPGGTPLAVGAPTADELERGCRAHARVEG